MDDFDDWARLASGHSSSAHDELVGVSPPSRAERHTDDCDLDAFAAVAAIVSRPPKRSAADRAEHARAAKCQKQQSAKDLAREEEK